MSNFVESKEMLLDQIYYKIKEIDSYIKYSSLYYEKCQSRKGRTICLKIGAVLLTAIPAIIDLLVVNNVIDGKNIFVLLLLGLVILIPIVISVFGIDSETVQLLFSRNDRLMELNETFCQYSVDLEELFRKANAAEKRDLNGIHQAFDVLVQKHIKDEQRYIRLTGVIDKEVDKRALAASDAYLRDKYKDYVD